MAESIGVSGHGSGHRRDGCVETSLKWEKLFDVIQLGQATLSSEMV